jgi:diaminopimelate decarboxylase
MTQLNRIEGRLFFEEVPLDELAARYGTPLYVYSAATLTEAYQTYEQVLSPIPHQVCYAVKANSSLAILQHFARLGAGFDIVSGGELARVLKAGGKPAKVVFSGVGKTEAEMRQALMANIHCFNVESESELYRLDTAAGKLGKPAPISFRVNPDVDPKTHPYISTGLKTNKFGVAITEAPTLYRIAVGLPNIRVIGVDCHIGSQLTDLSPIGDALGRVLVLVDNLEKDGIKLEHIDIGGGVGISYQDEIPPDMAEYGAMLNHRMAGRREVLYVEPGRSLVGNAGVLLSRVEYLKPGETKHFAVIDAAMNDLMRPALYDAYHDIQPVIDRPGTKKLYDIVGPVCETGDFIGLERNLVLQEGDLVAILSTGAYGMSMSSNYNSRPRAAEVLLNKKKILLVRERETDEQMMAGERLGY